MMSRRLIKIRKAKPMEVIGFIVAAAVVLGLFLFIRSRVRAGTGSGRGGNNPTRPDKS